MCCSISNNHYAGLSVSAVVVMALNMHVGYEISEKKAQEGEIEGCVF
jgi:hypothetical protein